MAVLADGEVVDDAAGVLSKATGVEATPDSVFQIGSITKLWTSTLVMQLVDEGKVDLDAPIRTYLPDFRIRDEDAAAQITTRQLLCHTAGFEGDIFTDTGLGDDCRREVPRRAPRGPPAVRRRESSSPTTTPGSACSAGSSRCSARSRTTRACASTSSPRSA